MGSVRGNQAADSKRASGKGPRQKSPKSVKNIHIFDMFDFFHAGQKTSKIAKIQRRRNDNINKICVLEGVGEGENLRKIAQKRCFAWEIPYGHNKIWKIFRSLLSEMLLSFGRLLKSVQILSTLFDNFRAAPVFLPLLGGLWIREGVNREKLTVKKIINNVKDPPVPNLLRIVNLLSVVNLLRR